MTIINPVIFLTIVFASSVYSKCYECNTVVGGDCGTDFNPKTAVEVDCGNSVGVSASVISVPGGTQHFTSVKNSTGCLKAVVGDLFGNKHTIRTCYYGDFYNSAPDCGSVGPRFGFAHTLNCDICSAHLCNGSSSVLAFTGLLGFALLVALNLNYF
ncbi:hypothetical protein ACFFRR_004833 [Megaselia abdita]